MRKEWIVLSLILTLLTLHGPQSSAADFKVDFSFQLAPNGDEVELNSYSDKPILLEWAASWCTVCEANQDSIKAIYQDYRDDINFLSVSFGGSRDTLEDVQDMKLSGGYLWTFGLDSNDYYKGVNAYNGYTWLISEDLSLLKTWNSTILSPNDLVEAFNEYLDLEVQGSYEESFVPLHGIWLFLPVMLIPLIRRSI